MGNQSTVNQSNLQAILFKYLLDHVKAQAHDRLQEHNNADREAIDAIYAGLLAVIGDIPNYDATYTNDTPSRETVEGLTKQRLIKEQRQALKRWCYGDTK